jgi:hypothetical protein
MLKNNPFKTHNINYLSPSSINTYISDMPMWVARYLFGIKSGSGAGAIRGIVQEAVLADKYQTGKFNFNLLDMKFLNMFTLNNLSVHKKQLKKVAFSIQRFLSISDDKHELASLVYPNFDSWTWSGRLKTEAKKIWADV